MTYFYCFIRTYFKSEEAPLCRIEFQLITTSHGNVDIFPEREGIDLFRRQSRHLPRKGRQSPLPSAKPPPSPKWKAKSSSVGDAATFPEREGFLPRETNIISGKITEIFIQFKIVRIYIIILLFLLFLPFSIDLKPENMYNNIDITL